MEPSGPSGQPSGHSARPGAPAPVATRDPLLGSVRTAARVLRTLGGADGGLGVTEVARRLGIGKSTAHRVLATLAAERLLEHDASTGRYRLGLALYELGTAVSEHVDLHAAALPVLSTLRHRTGEMVHVAVLDGLEVVYVERLESHRMLPVFRKVGHRLPAHVTSSGKVLLASLPRPDLLARLEGATLRPRTRRTITDHARLLAELDTVASRGWATNIEEGEAGITSVGAPVRGPDGRVMAAISVVADAGRLRGASLNHAVTLVVEAAGVVSSRLGYQPGRLLG